MNFEAFAVDLRGQGRSSRTPGRYTLDNIGGYLKDFATRTFGPAQAGEIAAVLNEYYHLNYQRKPEHMGVPARAGFNTQ